MERMFRVLLVVVGCAVGALAIFVQNVGAQEGHPLTGSWHGEWTQGKQKTPIVMFMKWNNKDVEGTLNPGKNGAPLKKVTVDYDTWTVHIETDTKDGQHVVADGKMADIGSYHRTIKGTWSQGTAKGEFQLRRD